MGNVRASTKTRNMLIVDNVLLVAYDGFNPSELETECRSPMGEAKRLGDYIAEHYGGKIDTARSRFSPHSTAAAAASQTFFP